MQKPQSKPAAEMATGDAVDDKPDASASESEFARIDHAIATATPGERFVSGIQELKE